MSWTFLIIAVLAVIGIVALLAFALPPIFAIGGVASKRLGGIPPFNWWDRWADYWIEWELKREWKPRDWDSKR